MIESNMKIEFDESCVYAMLCYALNIMIFVSVNTKSPDFHHHINITSIYYICK